MSKILAKIAGKIVTFLGWDGTAFRNILVDEDGRLQVQLWGEEVFLHACLHEDGGADEINVDDLSGLLADGQTPLGHHVSHENGGTDEIDVGGLSGVLADDQPFAAHLLGGAKHTADTLANLNTKISDADVDDSGDPRDPNAHAGSHEYLGGDDLDLCGLGGTMAHIEFIIDGGGSEIAAGEKGHLEIPWPCTLGEVCLWADQSGSIVVDIWKDSPGNFPPTVADTITSATPPTLVTADHGCDSTLTGWTTAFASRHILAFNVVSCTDIERVTVSMRVQKVAG